MVKKKECKDEAEFLSVYSISLFEAMKSMYQRTQPVTLLDIATGTETIPPEAIKRAHLEGIDFAITLSDVSPTYFVEGYESLKRELSPEELKKVTCVLANARDLRRTSGMKEGHLSWVEWRENGAEPVPLDKLLEQYDFLRNGYDSTERKVEFGNETFDIVTGTQAYGSLLAIYGNKWKQAFFESMRVLRKEGYLFVSEMQIEKMNPSSFRTDEARRIAQIRFIDEIQSIIDGFLEPILKLSVKYPRRRDNTNPNQTQQKGDEIKESLLVYRR